MDLGFLRFYELFGFWVVGWLYGFSSLFIARVKRKESIRKLGFQDRFDILL